MRDDVLGVFGDPAQTGKPAGDDLREGKRTYLIAATFAAAPPADRDELDQRLGDPTLDDAGVTRLREIIANSGALTRTEERITVLTTSALSALAAAKIEPEARTVLEQLAEAATHRIL
jgi:geranylgeranyl diphosphate synthase, type I